jgi:hypothetical protein
MRAKGMVIAAFLSMLVPFSAGVAFAQDDVPADALAILDRVGGQLEAAAPEERAALYEALRPELEALADDVPAINLYIYIADTQFTGTDAVAHLEAGVETIAGASGSLTNEQAEAAAGAFIEAAADAAATGADSSEQLYDLGKAVERLANAGLFTAGYQGEEAPTMDLLEQAAKIIKAAVSADRLAEEGVEHFDEAYSDAMDLIPTEFNPALGGPAGIVFRDQLQWTGEMAEAATDGIDLVADAIESGAVDEERLAAITGRIEELAREGPWGSDTAADFAKKFIEEIPVLGKLFKAVWPEAPEEEEDVCAPINCDCDNLEFGILTGAYQDECRGVERQLLDLCRAAGRIEGTCHPTASGPNPNPPG